MLKNLKMDLQERDKKHIWHPLTQHKTSAPPIAILKAKGAILYGEDGKEYIDAISSWYTAMYGHCNKYIIDKVTAQMQQLDQIVFTGFTHKPAIELSEKLIEILPKNQQKIFFNDNGSTAVEAAIKMALQYYFNKGEKKNTLIAFEEGFHGDTFGAMSVSGLSVYNGPFKDFFLKVERIPVPTKDNLGTVIFNLKKIIAENDCAAFIYEPLVQGAAGMKMHDVEGLNELLKICKNREILTIADEVMTGFGKTGKNFASDYLDIKPDIICLSKALTAGVAAMSITSCTQQVYDAFLDDEVAKGFFHAHTYSANPLACSAAIAGIELLASQEIQNDILRVSKLHQDFASKIEKHPKVKNIRQLGVIIAFDLAIDMERYGAKRNLLFQHFLDRGVFLRPLGNTIYLLPPFIISDLQLKKVYEVIIEVLEII
jgi:adenosylmethionine-8-amino-7-oxononanoate aminotransferase